MEPLPPPLVPATVLLRKFRFMPLDVQRFLGSNLVLTNPPDVIAAAVILWAQAWHGSPAGSLPDDDHALAMLSHAGAHWPGLRERVLRGWIKCDDGRLYHAVLCDMVRDAEARRLAWREKTARSRARRAERAAARRRPGRVTVTSRLQHRHVTSMSPLTATATATIETPAESQIPDEKPTSSELLPGAEISDPLAVAFEAYNAAASRTGWPVAKILSPDRRQGLLDRLKDAGGLEGWRQAMARAERSAFLRGERGRGPGHEHWRPDLDFFLIPKRFRRLVEGNYDDRASTTVDELDRVIAESLAEGRKK
jgi:hypothetical protein